MNVSLKYGSHLACLIKAFSKTTGDVLELGTGIFSTPYLHYACMLSNRKLVSYENYKEWYDFIKTYENKNHEVIFVDKYANAKIDDFLWDVVLIDQTPDISRSQEAIRLKDKAKYIILHDTNPSNYHVTHYDTAVYPFFKYKADWHGDRNRATVVSNLIDLKDFWE